MIFGTHLALDNSNHVLDGGPNPPTEGGLTKRTTWVLCVFVYFLRVAVSASCQEPCCPAHIMFFHCVTLLCYAPDVEQIKMMMMMILSLRQVSSFVRG